MILTEEHQMIRDALRSYAQERLAPNAARWDKEHYFPKDELKELAKLGAFGVAVPEQYGGAGLDYVSLALVLEEIAAGDGGTSTIISVNNCPVCSIAMMYASEEQKQQWLVPLARGEMLGAFALTEPHTGSDAAALRTTATRVSDNEGDHYVLNGTKQFISGAGYNDLYAVMVRTGEAGAKGISCVLVEKGTPGLSFGAPERKLGWNASPTAQVVFDNCRVPVANRVGAEGDGFKFAMAGLDGGRINIGACSLGGAQRCLDEAIGYVKDRSQFGKAIADFQNTQFQLADMATDLEAARALLYLAAAKVSAGAPDKTRFAAMAKKLASDSGSEIVDKALQLFGGYGYLRDYPIERFWRDLRVHRILEGTNEVMRMIIGRDLLK
jgi:acyl-CoA dehydrogenase